MSETRNNYTSVLDIVKRDTNPFVEHLKINERITFKRFKRGEAVITDKVQDIQQITELTEENKRLGNLDLGIGKLKTKQTASFVLLYVDKNLHYKNFTGITFRILFYILYEKLSLGSDYIIMDANELVAQLNISKSSAYTSILELVNADILDKRNDYNWWINPNYFYRGNRLSINTK